MGRFDLIEVTAWAGLTVFSFIVTILVYSETCLNRTSLGSPV